jgi:hypothetical protein
MKPGRPIRQPEAHGIPVDRPDPPPKRQDKTPKLAGAAKPASGTFKSRIANRDAEGPRKASTTPRPTGKPVAGD